MSTLPFSGQSNPAREATDLGVGAAKMAALRRRDAPGDRLPDAAVDYVSAQLLKAQALRFVALLNKIECNAKALCAHYEGELLRKTMRAVAWRAKCDRRWTWLLVFVWLALILAVALGMAVYFAPQIAAWRAVN